MKEQTIYPIDAILRSEEAILEFGRCVRKAAFHVVQFGHLSEYGTIIRLGDAFVRANPGRRLPGGASNKRLIKKRASRLKQWAEEREMGNV